MNSSAHPAETELHSLMERSINGDGSSHHMLLEKISGHLRAYFKHRLARIGRGPTEAEDLVQEALIAIHTNRHTYDPSKLFTPWVYAIARYKFLDYLRRTKASMKDQTLVEGTVDFTANDDLTSVESSLDLERLLAGVSSKARRVIQYIKLDGLSVSEAAAKCGMSESAVKVSVHRGLKALASLIAKEGA